ncbi:MAG: ComEC/Rec2 family competence protein [Pseudomonadota bacterium]
MGQIKRTNKVRLTPVIHQFYVQESRRFVLWLPVFLGVGIWIYFALPREPGWGLGLLCLGPLLWIASGFARRTGWGGLALAWVLFCVALGFGAAILSARVADAPAIKFPVGETVEGRVLELSRSASGNPRLLVDDLSVYGLEPGRVPARVRLTVLDPVPGGLPLPGERIRVYANLMPTGEAVEPGAFDFRRRAFFEGLGGIGLTRGLVFRVPPDGTPSWTDRARIWLAQVRSRLSAGLQEALPGREGAFAAAIIVGDRAQINESDAEALRASNLAHLLAISGLHMGILTGLIFALVRVGLAALPGPSLRWPTKKIAALAALSAGLAYLALSGATVATQRAFIMVSVALVAILVNRPAISLRALALAAAIILLIRPISLLDVGFQMSFAATAALVAGYEAVRGVDFSQWTGRAGEGTWPVRLGRMALFYVAALLFTSLLAGLATAPYAAYHFNRTAPFGLLANLLAVPVMGLVIAPSACLAAVLAPFGLADWPLWAMGRGIEHVLTVAHWVGGMDGAVRPVQAAAPITLVLITLGGLWLVIWRGRLRLAGIAPVLAGFILWADPPPRPDVLVAPGGRLVGATGPEGRALDRLKGQSFAAKSWLRRDGDLSDQSQAAVRSGLDLDGSIRIARLENGWAVKVISTRKADALTTQALCGEDTLLILPSLDAPEGPCRAIGRRDLARLGALAIWSDGDEIKVKTARDPARRRIWMDPGRSRQ